MDGLAAKNVKLDLWDVVVMNASLELNGYYTDWWDSQNRTTHARHRAVGEHCSAFVATGSFTRDGNIVVAHNNWTNYMDGSRWRIIFDSVPAKGNRILMDGMPLYLELADGS